MFNHINEETERLNATYDTLNRSSKIWLGAAVCAIAVQIALIARIRSTIK